VVLDDAAFPIIGEGTTDKWQFYHTTC
jgi:hypothetical protein